jgi:hypothetical protein
LHNITIVDDVFGVIPCNVPGCAVLNPGQTIVITNQVLVSQTTTNTVVVSGEATPGVSCEAEASTTVHVAEPPHDCCPFGRPRILTMRYTGQNCTATSHSQDPSKVSCSGDPNMAALVRIRGSDKSSPTDSTAKVWFDGLVGLGELFNLNAANAGQGRLGTDTWIHIIVPNTSPPTVLQTIKFHTSCSQPLFTGDQFGAALLVNCVGENQPDPPSGIANGSDGHELVGNVVVSGVHSNPNSSRPRPHDGDHSTKKQFANHGYLSPSLSDGLLIVDGDFIQSPTGILSIKLRGPTPVVGYDVVSINGTATLGGALWVELVDDYQPQVGNEYEFLTAHFVNGQFQRVILPQLPHARFELVYGLTQVTLHVVPRPMEGDFNHDGLIDSNDLMLMMQMLDAQDPAADLNGDGLVDESDLIYLLSNWGIWQDQGAFDQLE